MNASHDKDNHSADFSSRRSFIKATTATVITGTVGTHLAAPPPVHASSSGLIRIGLVGCGGRGTGAAGQALRADSGARLVAMGDVFADRLQQSLDSLAGEQDVSGQVEVNADGQFIGFDAYQQVIDSDVDVVLLATPPHFRPLHLQACVEAGKHVFAEKPVAVDAPGVRSVLESTKMAKKKNLFLVSGLNSRYSPRLQELMGRIHNGAIGDIVAAHAVRYGGGVWVKERESGMTDMEYQMRNWYYFTWLSGDFNVEQFIHQYDQISWAFNDKYPERCYATGGRQVRTGDEYGHIYDHFSSVFEYAGGQRAFTTTRHQSGCDSENGVVIMGTRGTATLSRRNPGITGENPWRSPRTPETSSHQLEQTAFLAALREGRVINNGEYMAKSTMMAILARMSAYTGRTLTWEEAMNSHEDLSPSGYSWQANPPAADVAIPGVKRFV